MNFFITCYIYPLGEKVIFSEELGFYFDNPRNARDIEIVKAHWEKAYANIRNKNAISINQEDTPFAFEPLLLMFRDKFAPIDNNVSQAFKNYNGEDFFGFLAKITILAYFDDTGETARIDTQLKNLRESGKENIFVLLEDDNPIEVNSRKLLHYCTLLSLLSHSENEGYNGLSFLLESERSGLSEPPFYTIINYFLFAKYALGYNEDKPEDLEGERSWTFWLYARDSLLANGKLLDKIIREGLGDKLLYIGNILSIAQHTSDTKVRLIMLTSIIELLLTHNPLSERFNVDDSINKQFQLKAGILVYLNDKRRDINYIKGRLQTIYQQRSNVAHGNFGKLEKYTQGLSKKKGKEEYFGDLISDLYVYTRAILEEYLKDRKLVEFLKDG